MGPPPQRMKWRGLTELVTLVVVLLRVLLLLLVLLLQVEVGMGVLCEKEWRCTMRTDQTGDE